MRVLFAVLAIAVACSALVIPEDFSDSYEVPDTELYEADDVLLEAKATVENMKKKGATEADCKDLATTTCDEVEREVRTDQQTIDKLADGKKCLTLGLTSLEKAKKELVTVTTTYNVKKKTTITRHNVQVNFGAHVFSSLNEGNCNTFFGSRAYLTAKAQYETAVKEERVWLGKKVEATRTVTIMEKAHKRQVKHCLCTTKHTRDSQWKVVGSATRRAKQVKAHAKCKMMGCVLNGTPLTSAQCKSSLAKLKNKTLITQAEQVTGCPSHSSRL